MRIVIFGLTVSSTWGNGHAALWRGLLRALLSDSHHVTFFERDQPFYASHRDVYALPDGGNLVLYGDWSSVQPQVAATLSGTDIGLVTSYCPDGIAATELVMNAPVGIRCFYDLDTAVTLARIEAGESVDYIGPHGLAGFDVVLSYTGGATLQGLRRVLGAQRAGSSYVDAGTLHGYREAMHLLAGTDAFPRAEVAVR